MIGIERSAGFEDAIGQDEELAHGGAHDEFAVLALALRRSQKARISGLWRRATTAGR